MRARRLPSEGCERRGRPQEGCGETSPPTERPGRPKASAGGARGRTESLLSHHQKTVPRPQTRDCEALGKRGCARGGDENPLRGTLEIVDRSGSRPRRMRCGGLRRLNPPDRLGRPFADDRMVGRPRIPYRRRPLPNTTDMFLKCRRVSNVENCELAAGLRLAEVFEGIARLDRMAYGSDSDRDRQAPLEESAQTDELRGDRLSRTVLCHRRMLRRIREHRELLELRVAGISHSSGADLLVHGLTSGRTAD